jgi:catechol 2,3-dioxygenase-like lactoylglutathione lyase family enzyme
MKVLFIASFAVITANPPAAKKLYVETLGLPLESYDSGDYVFSEKIGGAKHFGVWPLSQAAQACFGTPEWPVDRPIPQTSVEFEVEDVDAAAKELEAKGFTLLHPARTEPWKQVIARLQADEGQIVGVCYTPWMHDSGDASA